MEHKAWVARIAGVAVEHLSINAVAERSGLVQTTLARRLNGDGLTADQAIAIAHAYGADVIDALLELGFITEQDLVLPQVSVTLADASDAQIVAEVARRITLPASSSALNAPLAEERQDGPLESELDAGAPDVWQLAASKDERDDDVD